MIGQETHGAGHVERRGQKKNRWGGRGKDSASTT